MDIVTKQQKINLLESAFGESVLANSGKNISVVCPLCRNNSRASSKKRKLSICLEKGIYHCWVCEAKGKNIARFGVSTGDVDPALKIKIVEAFDINESASTTPEEKPVRLPKDFSLLYNDNSRQGVIAKRYLYKRGLTEDDLLAYKIGISNENEFINRVIFPSFSSDMKLNFYLSRSYDENSIRKYKNCDAKKSEIIFDDYKINWQEEVILVEGIFDSIKAGKNAIPVLGSWIDIKHEVYKKIINEKSNIVLAFDPDVRDKTMKIAKSLTEYGISVRVTENLDCDIGDMTKEKANICIQEAKKYELSNRIGYLIQSIKSGSVF